MIAPNTLLVPREQVDGVGLSGLGDVFDNVTIEFELDPPGGAAFVENDDNWGVGSDGLESERFWTRGVRGQGVRIGLADSGMDSTHPAFSSLLTEGRLCGFAHFGKDGVKVTQVGSDGSPLPDRDAVPTFSHWHGTHCCGVLVGEPTDGKARGVAPAAELVVARVLELANEGSVAGIGAGLWWLTEQACDVVSLSLGWPGLHEEWAAPVTALLDAGIVVVAAVGNEFTAVGVPKSRSPANYLAAPNDSTDGVIIPVGAHNRVGEVWDDSGGEVVDWSRVKVGQADGSSRPSVFANHAARVVPSLVAPGVAIVSSVPDGKYFSTAGSSMAAPHLAGLLALVLSGLRMHDPTTRPRAAADVLLSSLKDLPPAGIDIRSGGGRVDLDKLLESIVVETGPSLAT
ncbi:MAG: S8 family serine peptidase [Pseudolysinimonas sp.]